MSARTWNKGMVTIWSLIAVLALVLTALVFWPESSKADDAAQQEIAAGLGPQRSPDDCVDKYNVILDPNEGNRLVSQGTHGSPEEVRDAFLKVGQHDPRVLQIAYNASPFGDVKPIEDWKTLVEDGCYTAEARDIYQQVKGAYMAASVEPAMAPTDGVNTGVNPGGDGFQQRGVDGDDRQATKLTFQNGKVIYIMHRCGNIVTPGNPIPGVPEKPRPAPPAQPSQPDGPQPPGKPDKPPPGVTPKDPSKDVNVNPAVPEQVRGPGTTPVGTDPGPATPVYDTPTGCNGPCPRHSDQPKPVATERPQGDPNGGSGNGGATQGPGPVDDSDRGQTTAPSPAPSSGGGSSGPVCGTGNPDDC